MTHVRIHHIWQNWMSCGFLVWFLFLCYCIANYFRKLWYASLVHTQIQPKVQTMWFFKWSQAWFSVWCSRLSLNGEIYLSFAIKPNTETATCRRQKDLLKARVAKVSLGKLILPQLQDAALRCSWESQRIWNFLKWTTWLLFVCCAVWNHTASVLSSHTCNWDQWDQRGLRMSCTLHLHCSYNVS